MTHLNERTGRLCKVIERTSALIPFCIVQYEDGTTDKEHCASLKRLT